MSRLLAKQFLISEQSLEGIKEFTPFFTAIDIITCLPTNINIRL